uniref:Reverse transcriptase domain-containing protein n=1 Tax=Tanacetum cinerariifolium TaxID=118510 RepID=A0A6L2P3C3_TANCI|nr:reverse transcriptase domain-containing protein [Tanacetum cinerariifolium]
MEDASDEPLIIEAVMEGYLVRRVYVDQGASVEVMFENCFENLSPAIRSRLRDTQMDLVGFAEGVVKPLGKIELEVVFGNGGLFRTVMINFTVVRAPSPYNIIFGRTCLRSLLAVSSTIHSMVKFPTPRGVATLVTRSAIISECRRLERKQMVDPEVNQNITQEKGVPERVDLTEQTIVNPAYQDQLEPADMTGIPRRVIGHSLNINPTIEPVAYKRRVMASDETQVVSRKVEEWVNAGIVRPVRYPTWISNPVLVKKSDGSWRMCIDFKNINSACPKDYYPLLDINGKIESVVGFRYKCFLDAYKGYHQVYMATDDEEKLHRENLEAYVDDMVIKSNDEKVLIEDIVETFDNLRRINMKLNPKKCSFGVEEGKFLASLGNDLGKLFVAPDSLIRGVKGRSQILAPLSGRSSSRLTRDETSNPTSSTNTTPKGRNRRSSKQTVENSNLEEHLPPIVTMADNRTMDEMLRAPIEGCAEAIVIPPILAEQFKLKHSLINMMTSDQFFRLEKDNPHDHIRWFNKITSTIKYRDVPYSAIELILFPFSLAGAACRWLEKEPSHFITTWEELVSKFINEFVRPSRTTSLHQDSLNAAVGGNLLERSTQDVLTIIENKSKVRNSRSKLIASQVKACDINSNSKIAKLTHVVNQQTSDMTTAMTAMLKQFQATPPPASVKAVEETCVTCRGAHPYYQCLAAGGNTFPKFKDNIQGYVSAATVNYNQGNPGYRPQGVANQMRPPGFAQPNVQNNQNQFGSPQGFNCGNNFNQDLSYQATAQQNQNFHSNELEKIKRMNETHMKAMQTQIDMVKNELRNEMKTSIQTSLSNQTNEIKNMMASLLQMNTASTSGSGSLPSNTVANLKGELKVITTRSGLVTDGPTVSTPPKSITPEVGERIEKTYTDPDLAEYTIKVPPPPVQKYKPPSQRDFVVHKRDPLPSNLLYPSRMLKQKQQEKDEEKLQELANTPLNENCSAVILKKLPEKLGDPGKFLIPCGFNELKCKALADLGVSINMMPLSVWKELADFVIVDYESDPRVLLILGRPFLRTARALIDVHGKEMILRDDDERLTLNMKHDTSSYSYHPQRESVNLINIFNVLSEDFLEVSFSNQPSGDPTFLPHQELTSLEVNHDIHDSEGCNEIYLHFDDNPLSGSTTYSANSLLEEFTDELALITYPPNYDDNLQFDIESDHKEIEFLLYQGKDSSLKDSIDQTDLANLDDNFIDPTPEMFTDEHALDYSSLSIFDVYYDDFLEVKSDADNVYDDPFDSKGEKIKEVDDLPSINNEDKLFNPGILIHEKPVKIITRVAQDKKLARSNASLVFEDFDPPFYEPLFFKDVPKSKMILVFSSENEEKVFKPGIYNSETVHSYFLPKLSHQGYHVFKVNQIFISLMKIFLIQCGKNTPIVDVPLICTTSLGNDPGKPFAAPNSLIRGVKGRSQVTSEGIRANPKKPRQSPMCNPQTLKEMQSLSGKLAALKRFISRSAEKSLPFFETLKDITKENKDEYRWTKSAEKAFQEMKKVIVELPLLTTPVKEETLYVYVAAATEAVLANFLSEAPVGTTIEEFVRLPADSPNTDEVERWTLFTNGASNSKGFGAGLVLISPSGVELMYALRLNFTSTNNEAEYEALLAGLRMARKMKVRNIDVKVDSKLVASQINGSYVASSTSMIKYLATEKE